ncbi:MULTISPECIES: hypothetical protein [Chryseobacterium group]|uniref:hypothetical protein n=1 Tax=Chryseobacterium group TaxID=2782232 RepID=UPI0012A9FB73|nr:MULTISPECIES: hypothetical protein [Chryseobacterium group]MDF0720229.1 hypothetical protein [Kaistella sp. PBT33-4]QFG53112.1 hypothetical protein F7R58_05985 [Chryseobacterium sp.]
MKKIIYLTAFFATYGLTNATPTSSGINRPLPAILDISTCYHQTVTVYTDHCGKNVGTTFSPLVAFPCGDGQPENSVSQTENHIQLPPPQGPLKPCTSLEA